LSQVAEEKNEFGVYFSIAGTTGDEWGRGRLALTTYFIWILLLLGVSKYYHEKD
jgi:hypothetical protein